MSKYKTGTIMYITIEIENSKSGVWKKIVEQCQALSKIGLVTYLVCGTDKGISLLRFDADSIITEEYLAFKTGNMGMFGHITFYRKLLDFAFAALERLDCSNIYFRAAPLLPFLMHFLKKVKTAGHKTFWEIPTYPYRREYIGDNNYKALFFDLCFFNSLKKHIDYFMIVSDVDQTTEFGNKLIMISNGINVTRYPVKLAKPGGQGEACIDIIGVAQYGFWHGYDRLIEGLKIYKHASNNISIRIHFIGTDMEELQQAAKKYGMEDNVFVYGSMSGDELDAQFNQADIAIASLGMHRMGFNKTAALKIREYFSRGIPYITGCEDVDIPEDYPYKMVIPADDTPVNIDEVICFIHGLPEQNIYSKEMRCFAERNLDWTKKMWCVRELCIK